MEGLILKGIGGFYYVKTSRGVIECRARGRFRKDNIKPAAGDRVLIDVQSDGTGYLLEIFERKNHMIRPPLANVDRMFIVAAAAKPEPNLLFVDKIAAICELKGIEPVIVINKLDLYPDSPIPAIYRHAGFKTVALSAERDDVKSIFEPYIKSGVSAFTGASGVGKSSIINRLGLGASFDVGGVSSRIERGRHTTRHVELVEAYGGYVADTPGFSSYDIERLSLVDKEELCRGFRDFLPYIDDCRFTGCSHTKEKGCAVIAAAEAGRIEKTRHASYCTLYEQIKDIKPWD
ncbi:MAG: ribosome small subunit-dependent GTPase A [Clostridia bacterium]|nr:ribosome small subunit-dependent GTPase A [Clostridia bacterium]